MESKHSSFGGDARPRLERTNAFHNVEYKTSPVGFEINVGGGGTLQSGVGSRTSFRIRGASESEIDVLYSALGLTGPDDFAIPLSVWLAATKSHSDLSIAEPSPPVTSFLDPPASQTVEENSGDEPSVTSSKLYTPPAGTVLMGEGNSTNHPAVEEKIGGESPARSMSSTSTPRSVRTRRNSLSNGAPAISMSSLPPERVDVATPPPATSALPLPPGRLASSLVIRPAPVSRSLDPEEEKEHEGGDREGETDSGAPSTSEKAGASVVSESGSESSSRKEDLDLSSGDRKGVIGISPHGSLKRTISSWMRGQMLGSGSFGSVYEAISHDGFFFAVKEVFINQGSNVMALEQEISLLSRLQHENIVQYFGTDMKEGKLYIFLELVTQGSLASLYKKYKLQDSQVSAYTRQILNGLSYLHHRNVLHRDIKCANILVDANGCVKLADFGLAKEIDLLNQTKSCKGSVYWMAPEVAKAKPHGPPADIWSLGCTVLEMLTGDVPYPNVEWTQALFKIGRGERPPIPNNLSEDARDFVDKCLQVNPRARSSANDLLVHPFVRRLLV